MPAIVKYKSNYPSLTRPFESSASIAADGLVTGIASFLVSDASNDFFQINSPVDQTLFSSLSDARLSGLFVEARSVQKRGGLWILQVKVVGAVNPPVIERRVDISPRSLNKSEERIADGDNNTLTFSFDYSSETTTASTVIARSQNFNFSAARPKVVNIWNRNGSGVISRQGVIGLDQGQVTTEIGRRYAKTLIVVYPRILSNETREERAGVVRISKTSQFIYE
jgi:hypothetical protein